MNIKKNITLIGMPGVGKSTVGVLLAKYAGMGFVDTDVIIQSGEARFLHNIIETEGIDGFRAIEARYILAVTPAAQVVATGGSVVYSDRAMQHLKSMGPVIFLELDLETLEKRVGDLDNRGVLRAPGQTVGMLYKERIPLYRKYADITVACQNRSPEGVVRAIESALEMI